MYGLLFDVRDAELAAASAARPASRACCSSSSSSCGSLSLPVAGSKSLPDGNSPAIDADQLGLEAPCVARLANLAEQVPPGGRAKRHPLPLALDDHPHRHALHAAGRKLRPRSSATAAARLRSRTADRECGAFPGPGPGRRRCCAGLRQRLLNRLLGDFVKHQPMHGHFRLQHFAQMPTDGLPFAVFVRRQIELVGVLEQSFQLA